MCKTENNNQLFWCVRDCDFEPKILIKELFDRKKKGKHMNQKKDMSLYFFLFYIR